MNNPYYTDLSKLVSLHTNVRSNSANWGSSSVLTSSVNSTNQNSLYTLMLGGSGHWVEGSTYSTILNGRNNVNQYSRYNTTINGYDTRFRQATYSTFTDSAFADIVLSDFCSINNSMTAAIVGSHWCNIRNGYGNKIYNGWYSGLHNGRYNTISFSKVSDVLNGYENYSILDWNSTVFNGLSNISYENMYSFMMNGRSNRLTWSFYSGIFNGNRNVIKYADHSFILGGENNRIIGSSVNQIITGACIIGTGLSATKHNTLYTNNIINKDTLVTSKLTSYDAEIYLTSPSNLKFKLTVDDDGLIQTATKTVSGVTVNNSYDSYPYTPNAPLTAFLVGYQQNDKVFNTDPEFKTIKIQINDLIRSSLTRVPFVYTENENLSAEFEQYDNIGRHDHQITDSSYNNSILCNTTRPMNGIHSGSDNLILNSWNTYFQNATACGSILTNVERVEGERNLTIGGEWNYIYGSFNTAIGAMCQNNTLSGFGNIIINSITNTVSTNNNFITIIGGGINTLQNSDVTGLFNTIDNTVNGTLQCNIIGGEGNQLTQQGVSAVSGVTLIGVYDRVITPQASFYTITENLSVLDSFSSDKIILTSPNGNKFKLLVTNTGSLSAVQI